MKGDLLKDLLGPVAEEGGERIKDRVYGGKSKTSENPQESVRDREERLLRQRVDLYFDQKEAEFKEKCSSAKTKRVLMSRGKDWLIGGVVLLALMKVYDFVKSRKPKEHK